jgi:Na+/H+ antiporter NhaD/arsenite permease-like protein
MVFLAGAAITIFFSNDATALALTPLVLIFTRKLRLDLTAVVCDPGFAALPLTGRHPGHRFLVGAATNVTNNLPAALVMVATLRQAPGPPPELLYGTILGADLGPCLSITGSIATLLWLLILRQQGVQVSGWSYLKIGVIVTPAVPAAAALGLWLMLLLTP